MKISTDSILIGAWAEVSKAKNILDIGTGTGIIALMLAQRAPSAKIDAIDIDKRACIQAEENFAASKWHKRLHVYNSSLQDFYPMKIYDVIVSNPPFFSCPPIYKKKKEVAQARYTHKLSFQELADNVCRLLTRKGNFYVILPVHEGACFTNEAEKRNLYLTNYTWVKTTNQKKFPKRILMCFGFYKKEIKENNVLVIQNGNHYTDEYKKLTRSYYTYF